MRVQKKTEYPRAQDVNSKKTKQPPKNHMIILLPLFFFVRLQKKLNITNVNYLLTVAYSVYSARLAAFALSVKMSSDLSHNLAGVSNCFFARFGLTRLLIIYLLSCRFSPPTPRSSWRNSSEQSTSFNVLKRTSLLGPRAARASLKMPPTSRMLLFAPLACPVFFE